MPSLTRILLIDDDTVDRQAVRRMLAASDLNWDLTEANDGASGLALARKTIFDCVLLDYRLPDVDAFNLLVELLSPEGGRQAVMMLTGEGDPEIAIRLMRAGALDHLSKAELTPPGLARAIRYARARREFLRELEEKSQALDALNRQKSLLFSIIAHDLRNPFQVLLGLSENLSKAVEQRDPPAIEKRAQGIRQAAGQAHTLMESLFNWANLQMDNVAVQLTDIDLQQVADAAVQSSRQAAAAKGIALKVDGRGFKVRSNPDILTTILRNLLGNAIKFTPAGGEIAITARGGEAVELRVSDTGVGIAPDILDSLFELDQRTTTKGTAGESGSGLGLLICRDLAERLDSQLSVSSEEGKGTTFSVTLPFAKAAIA